MANQKPSPRQIGISVLAGLVGAIVPIVGVTFYFGGLEQGVANLEVRQPIEGPFFVESEIVVFPLIVRVCLVLVLALLSFGLWRKNISTSAFVVMLSSSMMVAILLILPFENASVWLWPDWRLIRVSPKLKRFSITFVKRRLGLRP